MMCSFKIPSRGIIGLRNHDKIEGTEVLGYFDGKFTIAIRNGETKIIISYVGFVSQEINIEGQNNISHLQVANMPFIAVR